jgi:putative tricarboxylic transport membrane protein
MKKGTMIAVVLIALGGMLFASGQQGAESSGKAWEPSRNVEWYVTSSAGGGSDIFTRTISDIIGRERFSNATITVINKTDGGGNVGRVMVANTTDGNLSDHTLLALNGGDSVTMFTTQPLRMADFKPLAILSVDKHFLYVTKNSKYKSFKEVIDAIKSGEKVSSGGSRMGDEVVMYEMLSKELGWTKAQFAFVGYGGSGEAITAALGGHIDISFSKPAAANSYVDAGELIPILACSTKRYPGNLSSAPTLSELGYKNVEFPLWRGVVGPKTMSDEAAAYWAEVFKKVSQTEAWKKNYLQKFLSAELPLFGKEAADYMTKYQADFLAANKK